jgi:O-methyltransferase
MDFRRWPLFARSIRALAPVGQVDAIAGGRVAGWALGGGPVQIEAWLDGNCVARCEPSIFRTDVAAAYPGVPGAGTSGFAFQLPSERFGADFLGELRIVARHRQPWRPSATLAKMQIATPGATDALASAPDSKIRGPFPRDVINAIASRWPEDCTDLLTLTGQRRFVDRLLAILDTPDLNALPAFADYARYLSITYAHCRFVERCFPQTNRNAAPGASDFHCKPNSVRELFPIIHQLYVLKSWSVEGDFAEFGCFKGYSSAMLSFACHLLGIQMHIFDSFEGLPATADAGYLEGEYAGSIDEVRDHISRFGVIDAVQFHKGFFADTFRDWKPPRLMCLWMDVDLEESAEDLMVVADRLSPESTLFSHECSAGIFRNGSIVTNAAPDNPIPPMLARHEELGRPLTGCYVSGYTGAFWPQGQGIAVVDNEVLMHMARLLC